MEKKPLKIDLTKKEGSLANVLLTNNDNIQTWYKSVNVVEMRANVEKIIMDINDKPFDKKSADTKMFILNLRKKKNKDDILMLVWNTIQAGCGNKVI